MWEGGPAELQYVPKQYPIFYIPYTDEDSKDNKDNYVSLVFES